MSQLKNKPTPRWVQASGLEGVDTRQPAPSQDGSVHTGLNPSSFPIPSIPTSNYGYQGHHGTSGAQLSPSSQSRGPSDLLDYSAASPFNHTANTTRAPGSPPDLTSAFSGLGFDTNFLPVNLETTQSSQPVQSDYASVNHCGCLHEPTSYRTMLELSLGLRRATDVLGQSPGHRLGEFCPLHQRILELDSYAM